MNREQKIDEMLDLINIPEAEKTKTFHFELHRRKKDQCSIYSNKMPMNFCSNDPLIPDRKSFIKMTCLSSASANTIAA